MEEGGKRVAGTYDLLSSSEQPIVTVLTVVYNRKDDLAITIPSVINQTYRNIEYVVVDGGSSDGTLEVIKQYGDELSYWISEKDEGLYDAMNKALGLATGDYVWFMNAGDEIYHEDTTRMIISIAGGIPDIYFGETMMIDEERKEVGIRSEVTNQRLPYDLTWKSLKRGMVVCHQSILVRRSIAPPYILDHLYSADIDWVIKCLKKAELAQNANAILSKYLMGGFSKQHHRKSLWDRYDILKRHYGFLPNLFNHAMITMRSLFAKKQY